MKQTLTKLLKIYTIKQSYVPKNFQQSTIFVGRIYTFCELSSKNPNRHYCYCFLNYFIWLFRVWSIVFWNIKGPTMTEINGNNSHCLMVWKKELRLTRTINTLTTNEHIKLRIRWSENTRTKLRVSHLTVKSTNNVWI